VTSLKIILGYKKAYLRVVENLSLSLNNNCYLWRINP